MSELARDLKKRGSEVVGVDGARTTTPGTTTPRTTTPRTTTPGTTTP